MCRFKPPCPQRGLFLTTVNHKVPDGVFRNKNKRKDFFNSTVGGKKQRGAYEIAPV